MGEGRWRTGRSLGRTVYCGPGAEDLRGMMDTPEIAARVCAALNAVEQEDTAALMQRVAVRVIHYGDPVRNNRGEMVRFVLYEVPAGV